MLVQTPMRWKLRNYFIIRLGQFKKPRLFVPEIIVFDVGTEAKKHGIQQPFDGIFIKFHNQSSQGNMMNIAGDGSSISCAEITALRVTSRC